MGTRDVEEVVLRPMQRLYLPPRHLRHHDPDDPDAREEALREYRAALEPFSRAVLERAWKRLRETHEFSIWPTPAALRRLAEAEQRRSGERSAVEAGRQRAWEAAEEYSARFMHRRQVAKLAAREGWAARLRAYVEASAWVQAQLIEGLAEEGISLPPELTRTLGCRSAREALAAFQQECAVPVAEGRIEVRVPKGLVQRWQEEAARHQNEPSSPPLDEVLNRLKGRGGRGGGP